MKHSRGRPRAAAVRRRGSIAEHSNVPLLFDGDADCDGLDDGRVPRCNFAGNFCVYDFNSDGVIDARDAGTMDHGADLSADGALHLFDVAAYLQVFSADRF
ncbi:MAG: hypothetical protein DYG94_01430 [Leptolyngbya sp. PLA3]|nr:MAG: hypothetical protein EDM82_00450 [Cyanobacteria bacterium CYA]MCE7967393.1 hypothetical protein [Leptolyngbya sp. PL-A3]